MKWEGMKRILYEHRRNQLNICMLAIWYVQYSTTITRDMWSTQITSSQKCIEELAPNVFIQPQSPDSHSHIQIPAE